MTERVTGADAVMRQVQIVMWKFFFCVSLARMSLPDNSRVKGVNETSRTDIR